MKRSSSYLIALLILVIVVALLGIIVLQRRAPEDVPPAATAAPGSVETPAPAPPSAALPEATESLPPTEPPVFETRAPLESEEPQPEESAEPTPELPVEAATGSLRSDTGTGLNIAADWETFTDADGSAKLRVSVSVSSYSFFTSSLYQSIVLTVDGADYSADSPAISYDGADAITTPMAAFTVDAPPNGTHISVVWNYRGSYSGKQIETIRADGFVIY